jgi:hypothetical protein
LNAESRPWTARAAAQATGRAASAANPGPRDAGSLWPSRQSREESGDHSRLNHRPAWEPLARPPDPPLSAFVHAVVAARELADVSDERRRAHEPLATQDGVQPSPPEISDMDRARAGRILRQLGTHPPGARRR